MGKMRPMMGKIIRPTYSAEFSVGLLLLIFIFLGFLSHQIFDVSIHDIKKDHNHYVGMFLASTAAIIMVLIVWEEILFPVKIKVVDGGLLFRNHRTKLIVQLAMYCSIPLILTYIYFEYDVNHVRFFVWGGICMIMPIAEKLLSGVNNYKDFLKLTSKKIEYRNNDKVGIFDLEDIDHISLIRDEKNFMRKIQLFFKNNSSLIIDLDEMELEAFYDSIHKYITIRYKHLLK